FLYANLYILIRSFCTRPSFSTAVPKPVTLGKKGILCFRHTKPPYIFGLIVNDNTAAGLIFFIILLYFDNNFKSVYGFIPRLSKRIPFTLNPTLFHQKVKQ